MLEVSIQEIHITRKKIVNFRYTPREWEARIREGKMNRRVYEYRNLTKTLRRMTSSTVTVTVTAKKVESNKLNYTSRYVYCTYETHTSISSSDCKHQPPPPVQTSLQLLQVAEYRNTSSTSHIPSHHISYISPQPVKARSTSVRSNGRRRRE